MPRLQSHLAPKICPGRKVTYHYDGELLTSVTYPNGGTVHYQYTKEGYICGVIDPNGQHYVQNSFDDKGGVSLSRIRFPRLSYPKRRTKPEGSCSSMICPAILKVRVITAPLRDFSQILF